VHVKVVGEIAKLMVNIFSVVKQFQKSVQTGNDREMCNSHVVFIPTLLQLRFDCNVACISSKAYVNFIMILALYGCYSTSETIHLYTGIHIKVNKS